MEIKTISKTEYVTIEEQLKELTTAGYEIQQVIPVRYKTIELWFNQVEQTLIEILVLIK